MNYVVWCSARGKVFPTLDQAAAYAEKLRRESGVVVAVEETSRKVTHIYAYWLE